MRRRLRETPPTTILIDTHILLWFVEADSSRLVSRVRETIADAQRRGTAHVSDYSFWEVALKSSRGRLASIGPLDDWIARAVAIPGLISLPIERPTLITSARLPAEPPNDPVDRYLIAVALAHGLTLVTADRAILAYARRHPALRVLDTRA